MKRERGVSKRHRVKHVHNNNGSVHEFRNTMEQIVKGKINKNLAKEL